MRKPRRPRPASSEGPSQSPATLAIPRALAATETSREALSPRQFPEGASRDERTVWHHALVASVDGVELGNVEVPRARFERLLSVFFGVTSPRASFIAGLVVALVICAGVLVGYLLRSDQEARRASQSVVTAALPGEWRLLGARLQTRGVELLPTSARPRASLLPKAVLERPRVISQRFTGNGTSLVRTQSEVRVSVDVRPPGQSLARRTLGLTLRIRRARNGKWIVVALRLNWVLYAPPAPF